MAIEDLSRRALLQAMAATIGAAALPLHWAEQTKITCLSVAEAADIEAVAARIVPTDETPGAREAGVIYFIDRALATFLAQIAGEYRAHLAVFQAAVRRAHPEAASFASLSSDRQIAFLKTVDRTPFFATTRILTLLGMFSLPAYGGNQNDIGWKLLGFEAQHMFQPPFGYYDRDSRT